MLFGDPEALPKKCNLHLIILLKIAAKPPPRQVVLSSSYLKYTWG